MWFGNQAELVALINAVPTSCWNHNSGGDAQEKNPIDGQTRWTNFSPGSGYFPRNWEYFDPSPYEKYDEMTFGDMPDLCHRNPKVFAEIINLALGMTQAIGFDGFRFDFIKGYAPGMVKAIAELRNLNKAETGFDPFCVGECWDGARAIDDWLNEVNAFTDNPVSALDFPLHYTLKGLCDTFGFSLTALAQPGSVTSWAPLNAVTFVDNHDTIRDDGNAIVHDKLMAYSFILTHEGYPSVFWMDWYNFGLAKTGTPDGIAALVAAHEKYAGGTTQVLFTSDNVYIMQRTGDATHPGLVFVLNNRGDSWNGAMVQTQWHDVRFEPVAWGGQDRSRPATKWTQTDGHGDFLGWSQRMGDVWAAMVKQLSVVGGQLSVTAGK